MVLHTLRQPPPAVSNDGARRDGERVMRPAVWRWEDFRVAAVALAVLASVAATVPQTPDRDVEAVINQWVAAFASLDGATSAAVYADDARLWGTIAQEPNVGHDAIRAYFDSGRQRAKARMSAAAWVRSRSQTSSHRVSRLGSVTEW